MTKKVMVLVFVVVVFSGFGPALGLHLKVDLGLIQYAEQTVKPGWFPWTQPRWADMYGHDCVLNNGVLEDGHSVEASCGASFDGKPGIDGTGIMAGLTCVREGRGGLIASGPEMCSLNCDQPASGQVLYEPICNTWFQITDWPALPGAVLLLTFYNVPPGEYTLKSYHNKFGGERNNSKPHWECICRPENPLSSVTALALAGASELYADDPENASRFRDAYNKFCGQYDIGSADGVELLEGDYNVEQQQVTTDAELVPSVIRFRTNGSPILVMYEGTCCTEDDIRSRDSARAVLNAFELISEGPEGCPCPGDLNDDGQIDLEDLQAVAGILLQAGSPFVVAVDPGHCADLNADEQVDLDDLQLAAGILLDAGSPFVVLCE